MRRFGANLKTEREAAGLSKADLAKRAELSAGNISNIENAKSMPRADTLLKLAGGLETSISKLTSGIDWEPTIRGVAGRYVIDAIAPE
jgi:transcriptional regulator with XRE-family HTH domain